MNSAAGNAVDWRTIWAVALGGLIASIAPLVTSILHARTEKRRERWALLKELTRLEFERAKSVESPRYVATVLAFSYLANRAVDLIEKGKFGYEELKGLASEYSKLSSAGSNPLS